MNRWIRRVSGVAVPALALMATPSYGLTILQPSDPIIAIDEDVVSESGYPAGEAPPLVLDGDSSTKYLNFAGRNSGFIVTLSGGPAAVGSMQLTTANDADGRDPSSYQLFGTNDPITTMDNGLGTSEAWSLVSEGSLSLPSDRLTMGSVVDLANSTAYSSYRLSFPTLKSNGGLFQLADVAFFGDALGTAPNLLSTSDSILGIQIPISQSGSPAAESVVNLIDGDGATKYLNFGKTRSGFIVTPAETDAVRAFRVTTANDAPGRDPAYWVLYGTNDPIASDPDSTGQAESWILIDEGNLALTDDRGVQSGNVLVDNDTTFASYKMVFTTIKDFNGAGVDSMQVAEIQFYNAAVPEPSSIALVGLGLAGMAYGAARRRRQA